MSETSQSSNIVEFKSRAQFEKMALGTDLPIIIDFWAPWCGPCKKMGPIFDKLAQDYEGKAIFAKVNTESHPDVSKPFNIRSIPTFLIFHNEGIYDVKIGGGTEPTMRSFVQRAVDHHEGVGVLDKVKRFFGSK